VVLLFQIVLPTDKGAVMGVRLCLAAGALGVCCLGIGLMPLGAHDATEPHWLTDFDKAFETAGAERKPVFVVFRCEH
jgi:hypothetical protein